MPRIVYRSWSAFEAEFELSRINKIATINTWVNAHVNQPRQGDVYLTTNGYDHKSGPFKKATLYAESYTYLNREYEQYDRDIKWDHRFHFNPNYADKHNSSNQGIGCFWKSELSTLEELKCKPNKYCFGMVLGKKGPPKLAGDIGYIRDKFRQEATGRSFRFYGTNWPNGTLHYGGAKYINGHRGSPVKFNDSSLLLGDCRFSFVSENSYHKIYSQNYLTEKIFHAFLGNTVPIYIGCWNVEKLLPDIFIDYRKFDNMKLVLDHCERMSDSDYNGYLGRMYEFMSGPGLKYSCDERFAELDCKLAKIFGGGNGD